MTEVTTSPDAASANTDQVVTDLVGRLTAWLKPVSADQVLLQLWATAMAAHGLSLQTFWTIRGRYIGSARGSLPWRPYIGLRQHRGRLEVQARGYGRTARIWLDIRHFFVVNRGGRVEHHTKDHGVVLGVLKTVATACKPASQA